MRSRQDRQPDNINVLGYRGGHNLLGGEANALVDDLEARIPRPYGDLLGAIGMAVEARLTDEEPERSTACGGEFVNSRRDTRYRRPVGGGILSRRRRGYPRRYRRINTRRRPILTEGLPKC